MSASSQSILYHESLMPQHHIVHSRGDMPLCFRYMAVPGSEFGCSPRYEGARCPTDELPCHIVPYLGTSIQVTESIPHTGISRVQVRLTDLKSIIYVIHVTHTHRTYGGLAELPGRTDGLPAHWSCSRS